MPGPLRRLPDGLLNWDRPLLSRRAAKLAFLYVPLLSVAAVLVLRPEEFGAVVVEQPWGAPGYGAFRWTPWTVAMGAGFLIYGGYGLANCLLQFGMGTRTARIQLALLVTGGLASSLFAVVGGAGLPTGGPIVPVVFVMVVAYAIVKYHLLLEPVAEEPSPDQPRFRLERSLAYLVREERPRRAFDAFADLVTHGSQGLGLVRTEPKEVRGAHPIPRTPLLWVGRLAPSPDVQAVDHPEELLILVSKFLEQCSDGVVVLDALEYLIQRHGSSLTLQMLYNLREIVARHNARLIVSVNPGSLSGTELALLEKELEPLPTESGR